MEDLVQWLPFIGTVIVSLISFFSVWYQRKRDAKKDESSIQYNSAQAAQAISDASTKLMDEWRKQCNELRVENEKYEKDLKELIHGINQLISQIYGLKSAPCWMPYSVRDRNHIDDKDI